MRSRDVTPSHVIMSLMAWDERCGPPLVAMSVTDRTISRTGSVNSVLSLLGRECLELLGGPRLALLRWCADENCTRPFLDRSHGHRRRWCGMKGCGDRAKAAAYRQRMKTAGQRA
ncbi:hypothetical protein SCMU_00290 [Sinomonas cyclohexanicum]|uniref:Zinc finger CGNR domain-containing protein n=1 Tax=Sinomonas cyclohexanicum TaxID=322009 RepID=A0ABN6FDT3_SINCY|nr:hypothetical protein SCMU_00290 [Corynebacterium cyclohexanicum]